MIWSSRFWDMFSKGTAKPAPDTYFEPFILKDPLDGSILAAGHHARLKYNAKRSIADDLALCI